MCGDYLVACEEEAIRVIDTRNEATCVFAADAEARISGIVGVAIVTAGPGATNTITAVKNAQMAQTPLLILSGAAAVLFEGRGSLQDIDQISIFKPLCKYTATITRVNQIVPTLRMLEFDFIILQVNQNRAVRSNSYWCSIHHIPQL